MPEEPISFDSHLFPPRFMHSHTRTPLLSYVHWSISSHSMIDHSSYFHFLFVREEASDLLLSATLGKLSISCLINFILIRINGWLIEIR